MRLWIGILSFVLIIGTTNAQSPLSARVVHVADGDTIAVQVADKRRMTIRLQGIDAPERTMPYSQVSRRHLQELVLHQVVTFNSEKLDRHGRTVAVVRLQDGTDVCLAQIQAGLAWHFKRFELEQSPNERAAYAAAEAIAKAARRGLWRDESPIPPWEFRAQRPIKEIRPQAAAFLTRFTLSTKSKVNSFS